ncbi:MAG TPA: phenylalanine--tRNA ligase subunit alpha [Phycisphaerae bacterium]|nr:phenylalanine--tRNA ligase subunit alpha [Phycisphaerae bacterium]
MDLEELLAAAMGELQGAGDAAAVEAFRIKYLGQKGLLKQAADHLKTLPGDQKRGFGQRMNEVKNGITAAYEEKKAAVEAGGGGIAVTGVDITEPGRLAFSDYRPGSLHIITQTINELTALFARMGFTVAEGPEVEDDFHNFEALNIPRIHPARDPLDNFYLDRLRAVGGASGGMASGGAATTGAAVAGVAGGGGGSAGASGGPAPFMLRSQTSSVQIRVMETQKPPIRIVAPGRVYRPDTVDATHLFQFHQLEALVVDRGISMVDLRTTIDQFAKAYFGAEVKTRMRPSFFPFTEPSAEVDVLVPLAGGGERWMEIGGCGMVDPNVFAAVGIDSEVYTGWAFGFGIERLIMRKHHIVNAAGEPDIRVLVENDLRFLRQF